MKAVRRLACCCLVLAAASCSKPAPEPILSRKVGKDCTVYLRRDALGLVTNHPVPPLATNVNETGIALLGKLVRAHDDWIVLDDGEKELAIPTRAILMIETKKTEAKGK